MSNEERILAILETHITLLEKQGETLEKHGAMLENLVAEQRQTNQRLDRLESDVKVLKAETTSLKVDVLELKTSTKKRFDDIDRKITALSHHQDTDYDTIHAVNKRIDILAAVSHDHEQKFKRLKAI